MGYGRRFLGKACEQKCGLGAIHECGLQQHASVREHAKGKRMPPVR